MSDASGVSLLAMMLIGLLGAGHCVGMCGGIATGLGLASGGRPGPLVLGYNLGRVLSYGLGGVLVASLGQWGREYLALGPVLRIAAGVILILMGLYLADWWRALVHLERAGSHLWKRLQPLGRSLLPVRRFSQALLLGGLWGWLPCGLVYSALVYAATAPSPWQGGMMMLAFGLGTAPAMVAGGFFSSRIRLLLQGLLLRRMMALLMILFGIWTLVGVQGHGDHGHAVEDVGPGIIHGSDETVPDTGMMPHHRH